MIHQVKSAVPIDLFLSAYDEFAPEYNNWFYKTEYHAADPKIHTHPRRLGLAKCNGVKPTLGWSLPIIAVGSHLKSIAEHKLHKRLTLNRINTNIQFYGQESSFHVDGPPNSWSFLLFMNQSWDAAWGGHFTIRLSESEYESYLPTPNCAILFPAHLYHKGDAPNRLCMIPRMSIAYTYNESYD